VATLCSVRSGGGGRESGLRLPALGSLVKISGQAPVRPCADSVTDYLVGAHYLHTVLPRAAVGGNVPLVEDTLNGRLPELWSVESDLDASERDPQELLRLFFAAVCRVVGAESAIAGMLDAREQSMRYVSMKDTDVPVADTGDPSVQLLQYTLAKRSGAVRGRCASVLPEVAGVLCSADQSVLGLRIATRNRVYGFIFLARKNHGEAFSAEDERVSQIMVAQFALRYEHVMLYDVVQRHRAALSLEAAERRRVEEALRESEAGLRRAQLMARLAHFVTGRDGAFESWSSTLPGLVDVRAQDVPRGMHGWMDLVHPLDRNNVHQAWAHSVETGMRQEIEYRLERTTGSPMHVRHAFERLGAADDPRARWFHTLQDVSESRLAQARIARLNRVYAVLSSINSAIVHIRDREELLDECCRIATDEGRFVMAWIGMLEGAADLVRPVAAAGVEVEGFLAKAPLAVVDGRPGELGLAAEAVRSAAPVVSNDVRNDPRLRLRRELDARGVNSLAILPLVVGGVPIGVLGLYAADVGFFDDEEMGLLRELAGDISYALDNIEKALKLDYLASYDSVTGLANRRLFLELLQQRVIEARSARRKLAVFLVDIERFKTLNDALGRQACDGLLQQVAERMETVDLDSSLVARIGADQFACIASEGQHEDEIARLTELNHQRVFGAPYAVGDQTLRVSARVGIAVFPGDGADADTLLRNAEAALKRAKTAGERYVFHTREMTARVAENVALENKLRQALENDEFVLHYQPKVDVQTRAIVGLEALLRWQSPELGLVAPARFVTLLEETGLMLEVGPWVLRRAVLDHRSWVEAGLNPPRVAVNVSAIQLRHRDFVKTIERALSAAARPSCIDLEITETVMMEDVDATIRKLCDARKLGIGAAIDDFGTGYSSLFYLARLPIEAFKIDRSFVATMIREPKAMTMVQTMISLAHSLRLKTVAEGVETEEQAKVLRLMRGDEMQGFLVSRPLPAQEVASLFAPLHTGLRRGPLRTDDVEDLGSTRFA